MGKIHNAKRRERPDNPDKGANAITSKERRKFLHPPNSRIPEGLHISSPIPPIANFRALLNPFPCPKSGQAADIEHIPTTRLPIVKVS